MSRVRVLVGTRKGAFILNSDAMREQWEITGPTFPGSEVFHVKGSPADPERLYASQYSDRFGQLIQRSNDGGKTWAPVGNKFLYDGIPGTHKWFDGTPHPWEFKRVWHLEPSLNDPDTVYAPALKTPLCSARLMVDRRGRSSPDCAVTPRRRAGNPAPVDCACTPFF
jgi:hypothetical protein